MSRKIRSKKGVSIMIGYVLLVSLAVIMGGVMYYWMKSYVPTEEIKCPDGTSIQVVDYNCSGGILDLKIKNNGRFDFGGYYIRAAESATDSIATIDLTAYLRNTGGGISVFRNAVIFGAENLFTTGNETFNSFDISSIGNIAYIELVPARWEKIDNVQRFAICSDDVKVKEMISCG